MKFILNFIFACILSSSAFAQDIRTNPTSVGTAPVGQIPGTITNDNAAAGKVGEEIVSNILAGSAVACSTASAINITSIVLTSGDWDISASAYVVPGVGNVTSILVSVSLTSATQNLASPFLNAMTIPYTSNTSSMSLMISPLRVSLSSGATYFLVGAYSGTAAAGTCYGQIRARRIR